MKTKYTPEIENRFNQKWLSEKTYKSTPDEREAFTIIFPPPNITGQIHLGHLLNGTIQDILIRRKKQLGYNTCWIPGIDHASIATEAKIIQWLKEQSIEKNDLTKEQFLEYAWQWKDKYGNIIIDQLKRCGFAFDWDRLTFTMDKHHSDNIYKMYDRLKADNIIYRGTKTMAYDPLAKTYLSDSETFEKNGKLFSERTGAKIEMKDTEQIFIDMNKIAQPALDRIGESIKMIPDTAFPSYKNWFDNLQDWCISRQLTWGHTIPDDEGTFDTWFSSWLCAITAFKSQEEIDYYMPSDFIITGQDIAFFWIAKMIMANDYHDKSIPFHNIYFTGIMRDKDGRKFAKQFNNSPDIMMLMDEHGADSLRFSAIINHHAGLDSRWTMDQLLQGKRFCNKIWNIDKLMSSWQPADIGMSDKQSESYEKWKIILESTKIEYASLLDDGLRFSEALILTYNLIWESFSSGLLEDIKPDKGIWPNIPNKLYNDIQRDFKDSMLMLEPFMPFISNHMLDK